VRRNRALGYDLHKIVDDGGPVCCEVMTNVLYALSLLAFWRTTRRPIRCAHVSVTPSQKGAYGSATTPTPDTEWGRRTSDGHR
jgi:hypothetical protein